MRKKLLSLATLACIGCSVCWADGATGGASSAATSPSTQSFKQLYIPNDLKQMDLLNDTSKWCYSRMHCTDNLAIMWERGFGMDLSNPPALEGKPMKVDLKNLADRLESFYAFFRDTLQFVKPGSNSEKYRMMVMLNYSLEGTAYGGDYDGVIGGLWVAPNRIQDRKLNCMAHELGHSFQSQISCDKQGEAWGGSGFFEMTSQWMLWQVNPDWVKDEQYHFDAFSHLTHKAFLHMENIYHSPYIIEYWGMKHGKPFIADLFRNGKRGEDPAMTYKRLNQLSQEQFCDEMFDASRHIVNMDYPRAWKETRPYACTIKNTLEETADGWKRIPYDQCVENYGFNVIPVEVPAAGKKASVQIRGIVGTDGYVTKNAAKAGWRYGFVAIDGQGKSIYGTTYRLHGPKAKGKAEFKAPKGSDIQKLYLVVMGAPTDHWMNTGGWGADAKKNDDAQWPYEVRF